MFYIILKTLSLYLLKFIMKPEQKLELNIKKNLPLVFEKKKNKSVIKTLKYINSDTGKTKHYPAGAQEWYNSIYTYNNNYIKSLPVLDKSLRILLKNYCNMWPKQNTFKKRPNLLMKHIDENRSKLTWKERRSLILSNPLKSIKLYKRSKIRNKSIKKIYVGKGNLKHTNNKVIVTLFTYNIPKLFLLKKIRKLIWSFFSPRMDEFRYRKKIQEMVDGKLVDKWEYDEDDLDKNGNPKLKLVRANYRKLYRPFNFTKPLKVITTSVIDRATENDKKIKYKRISLYNRRLTLYEYLSSSFKILKKNKLNIADIYTISKSYEEEDKYLSKKGIPKDIVEKVERLSKLKEKDYPLFLKSSYYNLLCFTNLKVKKTTMKLKIMIKYYKYLTKLVQNKVLNNKEKLLIFTSKVNQFNVYKYRNTPRYVFTKLKEKKLYLASLLRFVWLLFINDVKFNNPLLVSKLKYLVNNLYKKEVEFNIIELTKMHLNSDIYTQGVALKLTKRQNTLYWVLKKSLLKAGLRLPNDNRLSEKFSYFNKHEYLANKIRNTYINSMFEKTFILNGTDSLDTLLLGLFTDVNNLTVEVKNRGLRTKTQVPIFFKNYVLHNLKHLNLGGIRVEAKGRLTRRLIAQRSVFKMRYLGGLKNLDSSFKGLPAVMVRGFVKSNVEYSFTSSKNRIGAYGIKGWVGSF